MKTNQNLKKDAMTLCSPKQRFAVILMLIFAVRIPVFAQVNLNIGTLPPGKSVTVTFKVTINNPVSNGVCEVSNQGSVSGTNFSTVLTDDPDVGGAADPTVTLLTLPPCTISGPDPVCSGTTGNSYTALSDLGGASFSWSINGSGSISGSTTGSSVSVNAGESGSFTLTVTSSLAGCTSMCTKTARIQNPSCTISGLDPVCAGSSGNIYAVSSNTAGANFSWSISGGGTIVGSTTGSSVSVTAGSVGSYTLTVTSTTPANRSATCSKTVSIENPACSITGPAPVCGSSTNTYSALGAPGGSFSWAVFGDGTIRGSTAGSSISVIAGTSGSYTLTVTVSKAGCSSTCMKTVLVNDVTPPTITGVSVDPATLWPPNHKMRDVTVNYSVTDACGATSELSISSNEPENGTGDGDTSPDWMVVDPHQIKLRAERAANGNGRIYSIVITATDPSGNTSKDTLTVVVAHNITDPPSGSSFKVGTTVNFAGTFWDAPGTKHTAQWTYDNLSSKGSATEPSGLKNGKVSGSYKFNNPGVYKVQMNVTDQTGLTSYVTTQGDLEAIVVIYDPNGGYTFGGGWFASPAGSFAADTSLTGKVSFGFALSYFKNATYPKGETQFQFDDGGLEFNATNFDYLSISGLKAQFKGSGKVTGDAASYNFILTVVDGQLSGGDGVDKIRMKIFDKNTNVVIYDSQMGASDAADSTTPVGSGSSIVIQKPNGASASMASAGNLSLLAAETLPKEYTLYEVYPNPFNPSTQIQFDLPEDSRVKLVIYDVVGREVTTLLEGELGAGKYVQIWEGRGDSGRLVASGSYFLRMEAASLTSQRRLIAVKKMLLLK
jgi:hypothetical protein